MAMVKVIIPGKIVVTALVIISTDTFIIITLFVLFPA